MLAVALLLSTRSEWRTLLILAAFAAISVLAAVVPAKAKKAGSRVFRFLTENADTTSQTVMRVTVLLLVSLVALSAVFDLDIVLGAFAAGFVLRFIIPEGDDSLEHKLDGISFGFLIPVFFVCSGAKIDLAAVFDKPLMLVGFIIMLLLIRAVPIYVALSTGRSTRDISPYNRLTVSLYCTTALPLIVAVTSVAVSSGAMPQETAAVLVAAGAITVFLMPLLAGVTYRVADAKPIEAIHEIYESPHDFGEIVREHMMLERILTQEDVALHEALHEREQRRHDFEEAYDQAVDRLAGQVQKLDDDLAHVSTDAQSKVIRLELRRERARLRAMKERQCRFAELKALKTAVAERADERHRQGVTHGAPKDKAPNED